MATPTPVRYNVPHGATCYGGKHAPALPPPAWLQGRALNTWISIPGTAGAGGAVMNPYCGWAYDSATSSIYSAAAGGHGDSPDNRVVSIHLNADSPTWNLLHAATTGITTADYNELHYPDGTPASRHIYQMSHYVPSANRIMLLGARYVWSGSGFLGLTVDGFNLSTNQWDPAGYWQDVPGSNGSGIVDFNGVPWIPTNGYKLDMTARTWSTMTLTGYAGPTVRHPWCKDTKRNLLVGMCMNDGEGGLSGFNGMAINPNTGSRSQITINSSAALTQWLASSQMYAGCDYDPVNDCYLFMQGGNASGDSTIYKIIPNDTFAWDMQIFAPAGTLPAATQGGGINNRLTYMPALKGFVCLPTTEGTLYFIQTSN
jgi:hypothetical protein